MIYAVGDIHGQLGQLERVLSLIEQDGGKDARVIFLGDYTDRGPDSSGVLDLLIQEQTSGRDWVFLKGNHDRMFEWFMQEEPKHDPYLLVGYHWLHERLGGIETLASYGLVFPDRTRLIDVHEMASYAVPAEHLAFLQGLDLYHQEDGKLFVHAGIRPGVAWEEQTETDLLWIRQEFHEDTRQHPWLVVHGHTPVERATHYGNRINLDSGAGYGKPLSCAVFEGERAYLLTESGRSRLIP